jgi:hypothetical protein
MFNFWTFYFIFLFLEKREVESASQSWKLPIRQKTMKVAYKNSGLHVFDLSLIRGWVHQAFLVHRSSSF